MRGYVCKGCGMFIYEETYLTRIVPCLVSRKMSSLLCQCSSQGATDASYISTSWFQEKKKGIHEYAPHHNTSVWRNTQTHTHRWRKGQGNRVGMVEADRTVQWRVERLFREDCRCSQMPGTITRWDKVHEGVAGRRITDDCNSEGDKVCGEYLVHTSRVHRPRVKYNVLRHVQEGKWPGLPLFTLRYEYVHFFFYSRFEWISICY